MANPIVAIIGSPNVGKSTIFNRILGFRHSIIDDEAGITRDRIYGKAVWIDKTFTIIDTGGVEVENRPFQEQIRMQVQMAIDEADIIVFIVDGKLGVTNDDRMVAKMLYKIDKPIILAVNKIDDSLELGRMSEFYKLGLGEPLAVSGAHGIGIGDMLDKIISQIPAQEEEHFEESITFSLIGRPNVGKSSLMNALLNNERVIVSEISGTTRDAVDTPFEKNGKKYVAIDTAGLRKRGKIYEAIDKYAALRALSAIERSEIVLLLINAEEGIREQDKNIVSYAVDANKAIIIVVNKWDT
ncbi:MAG: ribosome biogenesis GTPase Der, partial [Bacilli bacterium]|nr:ribosome biogenesis GTPase Der [Bacilli bacterium]